MDCYSPTYGNFIGFDPSPSRKWRCAGLEIHIFGISHVKNRWFPRMKPPFWRIFQPCWHQRVYHQWVFCSCSLNANALIRTISVASQAAGAAQPIGEVRLREMIWCEKNMAIGNVGKHDEKAPEIFHRFLVREWWNWSRFLMIFGGSEFSLDLGSSAFWDIETTPFQGEEAIRSQFCSLAAQIGATLLVVIKHFPHKSWWWFWGCYNPGIAINTWIIYIWLWLWFIWFIYGQFHDIFQLCRVVSSENGRFCRWKSAAAWGRWAGSLEPIARTRSFSKGLGLGFGQAQEGEEGEKRKAPVPAMIILWYIMYCRLSDRLVYIYTYIYRLLITNDLLQMMI